MKYGDNRSCCETMTGRKMPEFTTASQIAEKTGSNLDSLKKRRREKIRRGDLNFETKSARETFPKNDAVILDRCQARYFLPLELFFGWNADASSASAEQLLFHVHIGAEEGQHSTTWP